jgi:hypothetical protein
MIARRKPTAVLKENGLVFTAPPSRYEFSLAA